MAEKTLSYGKVLELLENEARTALKSLSHDRLEWKFKHLIKSKLGFEQDANGYYYLELGNTKREISNKMLKSVLDDLRANLRSDLKLNRLSGDHVFVSYERQDKGYRFLLGLKKEFFDGLVFDVDREGDVIEEFLEEKKEKVKEREFENEKEVSDFFHENYGSLEWIYVENSNQMQALKRVVSNAERLASKILNRINAAEDVECIKKEITDYLIENFCIYELTEDCVDEDYLLSFDVIKMALDLQTWGLPKDYLYYTRDEDVLKAQDELWKRLRDVANEYGLDKKALWKKFVEHALEKLDEEFESLLDKAWFTKTNFAVAYYRRKYGFEDPKSGFVVLIDGFINVERRKISRTDIAKKFIDKLGDAELESLRKRYSEAKSTEEFERIIEDFLHNKKWELKQICLEESKGAYKRTWDLIETIKEMRRRIAEYLSSVDVEKWVKHALIDDESLRIYAGLEKREKLSYGQVVKLLKNELEVVVDFITQDGLNRELGRFLEDELGFKPTPEGYRLEFGKALGQDVSESERDKLLGRLNRSLAKIVAKRFHNSATSSYASINYDEKVGFVLDLDRRFFEKMDLSTEEDVISKFIEEKSEVLRNTEFRSAKEVSKFIDDNFEALERLYLRSCDDVWRLKDAVSEFIAQHSLNELATPSSSLS